jgi:hypothetical protein
MTWKHGDSRSIGVYLGLEVIATCEVENGRLSWIVTASYEGQEKSRETFFESALDDVAREVAGDLALELFPKLLEASKK